MKFLRNPSNGEVFAFPVDGSEDEFIPEGLVVMTAPEIEAHCSPAYQPARTDVDTERDRRMDSGIRFKGATFQSRPADRENITGAAQLAFMAIVGGAKAGDLRWSDPDQDFTWIAADNSLVPMDAPTVVEFGKAAAARKQALIYAARQLKDKAAIPSDYADDKWWP